LRGHFEGIDPKGKVIAKIIGAVSANELDTIIVKAMRDGL